MTDQTTTRPSDQLLADVHAAATYRDRAMAEADRATVELGRRIDAAMNGGVSSREIGRRIGLDHSRVVRIRKLAG